MMRLSFFSFVFFFSSLSGFTFAESRVPFPPHFGPGERLEFTVSLEGQEMGKGAMEIPGRIEKNGEEAYHLVSTLKTNKLVSFFWRMDDRVESYLDVDGLFSRGMLVHQRRKKKEMGKSVEFDQNLHRATEFKNDQQSVFEIPPKVQDPLSAIYYFRAQRELKIGQSVFIDLHQNGRNLQMEMKVLERDEVETRAGKFKTFRVLATVPEEGLFGSEGEVLMWFTEDPLHIPVMMESQSRRGRITARLSSHQAGENPNRIAAR